MAVRPMRAGINPAPAQQEKEPLLGAGFTPARGEHRYLKVALIRFLLIITDLAEREKMPV